MLARTCAGEVAPAMTDATCAWAACHGDLEHAEHAFLCHAISFSADDRGMSKDAERHRHLHPIHPY